MAAGLGGRAGLLRRRSSAGRRAGRQVLPARNAALPLGRPAHGARPQLHAGRRRHALPAPPRQARAAPDGLGLARPARRERCHQRGRPPARDRRTQHRQHRAADAPAGVGDRLGPRDRRARPGVLPLDSVAVPALPGARARLPQGGGCQLVPARPDRAGERTSRERPLRPLRDRGRGPEAGAVVLPDHRLRRRPAARPRADRLARADEDDPAQLDRALRGRRAAVPDRRARRGRVGVHNAPGHDLWRDLLRAGARAPAGRRAGRPLAERRGAGRVRLEGDGPAR